jgi:hypothetical protein
MQFRVTGPSFREYSYLKIKGVEPLVKGKADPVVLLPKWNLAREGRSEFYELSYWIWFSSR